MGKAVMDKWTDEKLAQRAATDSEAEAVLLARYKEEVRRRGRTYYILGADREDVVQEGMIGLFRAIRTFDPEEGASFRTYASTCIERQILDAVKRAAAKKHEPLNSSVLLGPEDVERLDQRLSEGQEDEGPLPEGRLLELLTGPWRAGFSDLEFEVVRRYLAGESYEIIAGALGKEPKAVYNAMGRIKRKIRGLAEGSGSGKNHGGDA